MRKAVTKSADAFAILHKHLLFFALGEKNDSVQTRKKIALHVFCGIGFEDEANISVTRSSSCLPYILPVFFVMNQKDSQKDYLRILRI